jgi:hypothetical protein
MSTSPTGRMLKYIYETAMHSRVLTRDNTANGFTSNCWFLRKIFLIIRALYELYGDCFNDVEFGEIVRILIDLIGRSPEDVKNFFRRPEEVISEEVISEEVKEALGRLYNIQTRQLGGLYESLSEEGESEGEWAAKIAHILLSKNVLSLDFVKRSFNPNDFAGLHATRHSFMMFRDEGTDKLYVASGWGGETANGEDFSVPFQITECTEDDFTQFLSVFGWTQWREFGPRSSGPAGDTQEEEDTLEVEDDLSSPRKKKNQKEKKEKKAKKKEKKEKKRKKFFLIFLESFFLIMHNKMEHKWTY